MNNVISDLPDRARVVVVGGGIIGASVAYHLAHLGWTDVVLLERDRLTSGTTWHAAGLMVTFGSLSETSTAMRLYTRDLYSRLEEETGLSTGFKRIGFIELAADTDRLEEYRRVAAFNRLCGVEVHEISAGDAQELFPIARVDDILAGFYVPGDGRANPADATMALAKGARMRGVRVFEQTPVTGFLTDGRGAVSGVVTARGEIEAEYVVNCAGMWARQLGALAGVTVPLQAAEHYYLITEPIEGIDASWPIIEDPSSHGYYREEVGGLMVGLFEPVCAPWMVGGVPGDASFLDLAPDWDRMAPYVEKAMSRVPISTEAGIRKFFCGPESFTPDLQPIIGEAPELRNYFVAAGLNSIGILTAGGVGRVVARWIVEGHPDVDVTGFNIDRLHTYQATARYRRSRTVESLGMVYQCHYPARPMETARGAKLSPLHSRLRRSRAYFRDVSGWEGADWFAPEGVEPEVGRLSWGRHDWFPYWRAEHEAARSGAVVMDMSFMSKFIVTGPGAGALLDRLSANSVDGESGRITYTQWLNEAGTIEADLTITKLAEDRFWVVATDTAHRHVETWMRRHAAAGITVTDATSAFAQINVQGPSSREVLSAATSVDLSDGALPFRGARHIDIGFAQVLCIRITYVGELGYELYVPAPQAADVYDRLVEAGAGSGLRHAGLKALSSLRMEKGYRDYGHDIDNTDGVFEAGFGYFVALDKPGGFIGRDAVARAKEEGPPRRRLAQVLVQDPEPLMYHAEVVYRDGAPAGYVRAASYGFTLGGAVGLAMIEADQPVTQAYLDAASWEVDIAGRRFPAQASLRPMYDPKMERVRCSAPPRLADRLPDLHEFASRLGRDVAAGVIEDEDGIADACDRFFTPDRMDEVGALIPKWRDMAGYGNGVTLRHTITALVALRGLPEFEAAMRRHRALMEWTVLLHDVAKEPEPDRGDQRHAFRSAAQAGVALPRIGFSVTEEWAGGFPGWYSSTNAAWTYDEAEETYGQDNSKLPGIIGGADVLFEPDAALVIKAVALHLSLTVVAEWPANDPLTPGEERRFVTPDLHGVLLAMMLADSGGWELFNGEALADMYAETREVFARLAAR